MRAYVTLLSSKSYLQGVVVLHRSLMASESRYPLYCMLSVSIDEETEQILEREGIHCIRLSHSAVTGNINPLGQGFSHWNYTFDKLLIWGLTQFEKIVFLDCDMLIVRNIDGLFEHEPFSAVSADSSYPGNESWVGGLNSGLMVIEPNKNVENKLLQMIDSVADDCMKRGVLVGDQDVIKCFLYDWSKRISLHLDEGYNVFADHLTYYIRHLGYSFKDEERKPIYVIHFIGKSKPWMKKTLKECAWMFKMCLGNPYYIFAYMRFRKYLKA